MPDAKQTATKLFHYLVIGYALLSLLYTARYLYTTNNTHQQDHTTHLTRSPLDQPPPPPSSHEQQQYKEQVEAQAQELDSSSSSITTDPDHALVTWHNSQSTMSESYLMSKIFSDAMQPSHLQPYYHKAHHKQQQQQKNNMTTTTSSTSFSIKDITLATLVTKDRFPVLSRLATNYQGPISVAIHVNGDDDDERDQTLEALQHTIDMNPDMQRYVDIHLIIDSFDRQFNLWRNVAKFFARTDYVMMLDVDFHLCTNLRSLRDNPAQLAYYMEGGDGDGDGNGQQRRQRALVVPAFEYVAQADGLDFTTFPTTKADLLMEVQQGKIDMFHKGWVKGHGATDYTRWYSLPKEQQQQQQQQQQKDDDTYVVTEYDFSYEPYIIYNKLGTPWCDERFIGYGANKAACLFEIYLSGIDYVVLPNDFLIHQTHQYPENTRRKERQYNRKLYSNFREELCLRYARLFMAKGEWDQPIADNLKKECAKNRGYRSAMKSIA